ncbi:MAG: bifunctional phosphoribosylaminoimidazolecarboxamide formyltransferase/IMP cyclohydrolase [Gemmatales bacterium]|nr:bifunctional phosphoribosylaminoimidazolecarboxamide formyltransferase/IMP cyclohydrolase [Gemmatales bacterium]MDW8176395.1 bifunctional phosphoribosylaminoimidazolecarboxamide formyltransferase/IMP cyclohydrolase [Gemmatales bacterium]
MTEGLQPIRRALLSVSDKLGLVSFAQGLRELGVELFSTGGTYRVLQEAGLPVREVTELTGFPEILDGRVKTLHPHIHAAILACRDKPDHQATLARLSIVPIDLVVCNLYPFAAVRRRPGSSHEQIIENIDIGGPTLVRAAAKNYAFVTVITDPSQYAQVLEELRLHRGALTYQTRERLAASAFEHVAAYDRDIAEYFARLTDNEPFPRHLHLHFERHRLLRYGENPHQQAAFYIEPCFAGVSVATSQVLHGKELSFNNILDLDSALALVREFDQPAAVIIKHNNPCGAAVASELADAYQRAFQGDPQSAYGGVVGCNRAVDAATALCMLQTGQFIEAIIAPDFESEALEILTKRPKWGPNVRLLRAGKLQENGQRSAYDFRHVEGGLLMQTRDLTRDDLLTARVVSRRQPTESEWEDLRFAWTVVKHVKSNAIVLTKAGQLVGVGAGQMSRVDAVRLAVAKAGERALGAVLASDAFFPFRDNVDEAAKAGITAIVQPGGSIRDREVIQACDEHLIALVHTGIRHFRH